MPLLECEHLSLGYPENLLVKDLSFSLDAGQCLCILGENGAGKSTLVRTLLHLQPPLGGTIRLGEDLRPSDIGYLPQQTAVQRDFPATVLEVVLSGCLGHCGWHPFYGRAERELAHHNLARLGLTGLEQHCFRELSGGQRQRALLARALCAGSRMLLLDEPATGLDPGMQTELYRLICLLCQQDNMGVLMVSHDLHDAVEHATHILHLSATPFWGTRQEYLASPLGQNFPQGNLKSAPKENRP